MTEPERSRAQLPGGDRDGEDELPGALDPPEQPDAPVKSARKKFNCSAEDVNGDGGSTCSVISTPPG